MLSEGGGAWEKSPAVMMMMMMLMLMLMMLMLMLLLLMMMMRINSRVCTKFLSSTLIGTCRPPRE